MRLPTRPQRGTLALVLLAVGLTTADASRLEVEAVGPHATVAEACAVPETVVTARPVGDAPGQVLVAGLSGPDAARCAGEVARLTLLTPEGMLVARGRVPDDQALVLTGDSALAAVPADQVHDAVLEVGGWAVPAWWSGDVTPEDEPTDGRCDALADDGETVDPARRCRLELSVHSWPGWWQVLVTVSTDEPDDLRWRARLDLRTAPFPFPVTDVGEYTGNAALLEPADCLTRTLLLTGVPGRSGTVHAGHDVSFQLVGTDGATHAAHELLSCR